MQSFNSRPRHVAIIMDGNGRWAQEKGLARAEGHQQGAKNVRRVVELCHKNGVEYLTLFSFSTENWQRSKDEVTGLMSLFKAYLESELPGMLKNNIRLKAIGDFSKLPFALRSVLKKTIELTSGNTGITLVLAISYGAREEIVSAVKKIGEELLSGKKQLKDIDVDEFSAALWTKDIPDPDLLIRTSGELRISNFLLWQLAYSEIYVCEKNWPDFLEEDFDKAFASYAKRERRFGLTTEQISAAKVNN